MPAATINVAQVTDTHLLAKADGELLGQPTDASLEVVIKRLHALRPRLDLLLLTGDLSQDGSIASYQRLQDAIEPLGLPTFWVPGNHDQHLVMQQVLRRPPFSTEKSFQVGGWQFVLLNSAVPGCVHGYFSDETLVWLDCQLAGARARPTMLAFHHPPFAVHSRWIDQSGLHNPDAFFAVLDRHPQVRLSVFGHIHQDYCRWRRDVCYAASPSTSVQFKPRSDRFSLDDISPGFRMLTLHADGSFATHVERVTFNLQQLDLAAHGY
ncbi:putative phosphohydrolase [Rubidibacter lacunae KORDI 51-2]|uniref:Putative phosphohydrolase n=1 Tax=Rubidibacter lacunae KORDI 51-2 TaxID=582515 RepID=U5D7R9_9CHRO|nr:3',5'-cyclic-AMP phosphodiesterase [Rubidibacter lacunae]ERN40653.1 putative phosphohydrolase [Rubidibacter lacunae KORDI 51-2]